ncbi:ABC transporter permease [Shinella sp. AETb1-6]|uniref:ABC transporter permease n=1 Tax=Shinella sp. AETb1-6 TaxID=2692210 RepID=UPI00136D9B58|nr:ABC transporter permease [Shinella sp. AETb1-6]MDP9587568.1 simple sugar transport system permease protein/ribose transport system permease protein [Shinella zoogloeoides]MXN51543.1 ABC transporter permease [Shinella sp. AETb1-6]
MTSQDVSHRAKVTLPKTAYGLIAILVLLVVASVTTPGFARVDNIFVVIRAASLTGIVAIGMSYITISGNLFALSASALGALLAVLFALLTAALGFSAGLFLTLGIAVLCGLAQSVAISLIGNPIITTLAFGTVFRGLAALFSGNSILRIESEAALWLGTARPLGIPTQSWAFIIAAILSWFIIRHFKIGREIVLCGANPKAAVASGLRVGLVTAIACAALSIGVAVMAIMTVSQFSQAKADLFMGYDFDYIAAVLVGGIALRGGKGTPLQAALGAVLIALLQNFMLLHGLSAGVRMTIVGLLVIASISLFHILQGRGR